MKNIDAYNETAEPPIQWLIFTCDEMAVVTLLSQIESNSTAIARRGRALRNYLVLAMQRPDTTILPAQIQQHGFPCLRQGG